MMTPAKINPFSTRFVKPGAIPFYFEKPASASLLVDRLAANGWCGQIIGPHGSGKSTLVETLKPSIPREIHGVTLHVKDNKREIFSSLMEKVTCLGEEHLLVLDGFEQLSPGQRKEMVQVCCQRKVGMLVTAHEDLGLPTLFQVSPVKEVLHRVVQRLLSESAIKIPQEVIDAAFLKYQPDLREALFSLYDQYERMSRG